MAEFMTKADVTNANILKTVLLEAMVNEGYIPIEKAKEFNERYAVILADPTWYQSIYAALFPSKKTGLYYNVVKFIGKDSDSKVNDRYDEFSEEESLAELKFQLSKAESEENYDLAKKLRDKILKLENKKKK